MKIRQAQCLLYFYCFQPWIFLSASHSVVMFNNFVCIFVPCLYEIIVLFIGRLCLIICMFYSYFFQIQLLSLVMFLNSFLTVSKHMILINVFLPKQRVVTYFSRVILTFEHFLSDENVVVKKLKVESRIEFRTRK